LLYALGDNLCAAVRKEKPKEPPRATFYYDHSTKKRGKGEESVLERL
jgi:hypothetical protein